ncbi:MAG: RagB/SusD family nutrient uptake outer membrane protein [Bacteroidota bacterium]|jgi:hypothetical protein|nr:MAG: RagB/SusD family nutrient uptake outer membrane protein [Bacteroidota bacterium]
MRKKIFFISLTVCLLVAFSCGEDILDKQNSNKQTTETYYIVQQEIHAALTGVYGVLQSNSLGGREWFFLHDLRSDEMASGGGHLETHRNQILIGTHDAGNDVILQVWTGCYRLIHRANAVIQLAVNAEFGNESLRNRYLGEAHFLRGWAYYQLYTLWGDVPIMEEFATTLDGAKPRSPASEVKNLMIQDFTFAIQNLPESYSGSDLGRATKIAAQAMLAKLYMFDAQYSEAKPLLEAVINYGEATFGGNPLMDDYFDNFTEEAEYNKESIWEISYTSAGNYNWDADGNDYGPNESWIRSQEYSAVGWRNLIPSDKLLAEFEDGDPRLKFNFYFTGDTYGPPDNPVVLTDEAQRGNTSVYKGVEQKISWKKYSVMYKLDPGGYYDQIGINYRMIRYADIYLLAAEVENEIGTSVKALEYLNKTRNRPSVAMPEYPTADYPCNSKDEIMRAIIHERMVELAGEEQRNTDILRWRKAGKLTTEPISYYEPKYTLLPIPIVELDANPYIDQSQQNPGY